MHKGNQAPLATTSSLPTASEDVCFRDNFASFSYGRKPIWEPELKHFPAQLSCLCPCLPQGRSKSRAYRKHVQSISRTCFGGYMYPYTTCRGLSSEAVLSTGPQREAWEAACSVLLWTGRRRGWRIERGLISYIKICFKMKPALGNLSALSKCIVENTCFLRKFFCEQSCSQRASSVWSSLVRTEGRGWGEAGCAKRMGFIAFIYRNQKVKLI